MGISNEYLLLESFSECPITPFESAPNYMSLNSLKCHLNACAALVNSDLGDKTLGNLVLTLHISTYSLLSTLLFMAPVNMIPKIPMPYPAPMAIVISELVRNYTETIQD